MNHALLDQDLSFRNKDLLPPMMLLHALLKVFDIRLALIGNSLELDLSVIMKSVAPQATLVTSQTNPVAPQAASC